MTRERTSFDFEVSDPVVGGEAPCKVDRPVVPNLIRLVVAELPESSVNMNEVMTFVRSHYPNAKVMFVAGPGACGVERSVTGVAIEADLYPADVSPEAPVPAEVKTERRFSPRQAQVAGFLVQGLSNKEIARHLGLSESTVKVHVISVFRLLNVRSRTRAVSAILDSSALQRELCL